MPQDQESEGLTPEEKLFKIIQKGERGAKDDDTVKSASSPTQGGSSGGVGVVTKKSLGSVVGKLKFGLGGFKTQDVFSIKAGNKALFFVLLGLAAYLLLDQVVLRQSPEEMFQNMANIKANTHFTAPDEFFDLPSINQRIELLTQRNAFERWDGQMIPDEEKVFFEEPVMEQEGVPSASLTAIAEKVRVTGLYFGATYPEALIEDTDEKRTYVIGVGDIFMNADIKAISPHGVVISDGVSEMTIGE